MSNTDFLSFLVDETLKLQTNGEVELSSLELKLNDYRLSFFKGEFIPQTQMLRFQTHFGVLDIPVNWSIFSVENVTDYVLLTDSNDDDKLLAVLQVAWGTTFEKILVTHADGFCYIVGLKSGDESHLHDLVNPQEWLQTAA